MPSTKKESNKGPKTASIAVEMTCCITLQLPLVPVTAEDGRVYEESAIQQYFEARHHANIKSPYTNKPMGTKLLPSPQFKNIIEMSIENGTIAGDLAEDWKKRANQEKAKAELLMKAKQGDLTSIYLVALNYTRGEDGFEADDEEALSWYERGHKAGCIRCTAGLGEYLVNGHCKNREDEIKGIVYLAFAAGKGSTFAAALMGEYLAHGWHGLDVDLEEARRMLEAALCKNPDDPLDEDHREIIKEKLKMIKRSSWQQDAAGRWEKRSTSRLR